MFRRSLDAGEVTFQDYNDRMSAFISCLEDSIVGTGQEYRGEERNMTVAILRRVFDGPVGIFRGVVLRDLESHTHHT